MLVACCSQYDIAGNVLYPQMHQRHAQGTLTTSTSHAWYQELRHRAEAAAVCWKQSFGAYLSWLPQTPWCSSSFCLLHVGLMWAHDGLHVASCLLHNTHQHTNASRGSAYCHTIAASAPDVLSSCCDHKQTCYDLFSMCLACKVSIGKCAQVYGVPVDHATAAVPIADLLKPRY